MDLFPVVLPPMGLSRGTHNSAQFGRKIRPSHSRPQVIIADQVKGELAFVQKPNKCVVYCCTVCLGGILCVPCCGTIRVRPSRFGLKYLTLSYYFTFAIFFCTENNYRYIVSNLFWWFWLWHVSWNEESLYTAALDENGHAKISSHSTFGSAEEQYDDIAGVVVGLVGPIQVENIS